MTSHATVETLSAYLDHELPDSETQRIEEHLEDCAACRKRFTGMRSVVAGLRHLERMAPPSTLGQMVTRRVALEGDRKNLVDRLENSLGTFERQSSLLGLFGLVIALAIIMLLFAHALEQHRKSSIPVIFQNPTVEAPDGEASGVPESLETAGRTFHLMDGVWVEQGLEGQLPTRAVVFGSPDWETLAAADANLLELMTLERSAVVRVGAEIVHLKPHTAESPPALLVP